MFYAFRHLITAIRSFSKEIKEKESSDLERFDLLILNLLFSYQMYGRFSKDFIHWPT